MNGDGQPAPTTRARVRVEGRVQGVYFRAFTQQEAEQRGVVGWVRNSRDGAVEAVFEGPHEAVEAVIARCRAGPPRAHVRRVQVIWEAATGEFPGFEIRY